tara:strand:- start:173 stop:901 length:729 start_codon:yes stop_codon:yes gene_type:complete
MFLFSAVKKVAEVAGVISDEPDIIIDDDPVPYIPEPVDLSQTITAKQVGNVAPYVRVIDPADDLAILEELFGVYRAADKVMEMSCPSCDSESTLPYQTGLNLDDYCSCPDCGHEDTFADFLDAIDTKVSTSRTPSDLEVLFAIGQCIYDHWDGHDIELAIEGIRESLMDYYAVLLGKEPTMSDQDSSRGRRDDGLNLHGRWMVSCKGCQDDGDGCQCNNLTMKHFGRIVSIKGMVNDEEGEL